VTRYQAAKRSDSQADSNGSGQRLAATGSSSALRLHVVNWAMPGQDHSLRPAQLADIESVSGEEGRRGGQGRVGGGKIKSYRRRPG